MNGEGKSITGGNPTARSQVAETTQIGKRKEEGGGIVGPKKIQGKPNLRGSGQKVSSGDKAFLLATEERTEKITGRGQGVCEGGVETRVSQRRVSLSKSRVKGPGDFKGFHRTE